MANQISGGYSWNANNRERNKRSANEKKEKYFNLRHIKHTRVSSLIINNWIWNILESLKLAIDSASAFQTKVNSIGIFYRNLHVVDIPAAGIDRPARTVSLRGDRGSRAFSSLELDTVVEERSDPEQSTAIELSSPD